MQSGHIREAVGHFEQAISLYHTAEYLEGEASAIGHLADCRWRLGEAQKAQFLYEQALVIADKVGAVITAAEQHIGLGTIAQTRGTCQMLRTITRPRGLYLPMLE